MAQIIELLTLSRLLKIDIQLSPIFRICFISTSVGKDEPPVTAGGYSIGVNPVYLTISISTILEVYLTIIKI